MSARLGDVLDWVDRFGKLSRKSKDKDKQTNGHPLAAALASLLILDLRTLLGSNLTSV
jgi:hypothetical protein